MDAGAAVEKIRAAGLLRTGGLIGGKWVDAYDGKTIEVQNPATGEVLANVACMGSRETSDAIASAHSTFSYIFRPFVGFREVRLVNKESRHPGGDPHVLCFVDFDNPGQATVAFEALQGYKFDEHDRDSAHLRLQFSRFPGPRSAGGPRGRR